MNRPNLEIFLFLFFFSLANWRLECLLQCILLHIFIDWYTFYCLLHIQIVNMNNKKKKIIWSKYLFISSHWPVWMAWNRCIYSFIRFWFFIFSIQLVYIWRTMHGAPSLLSEYDDWNEMYKRTHAHTCVRVWYMRLASTKPTIWHLPFIQCQKASIFWASAVDYSNKFWQKIIKNQIKFQFPI